MCKQTAELTASQWADILALVERGKDDLANYRPHADKDGYTAEELQELDRLASSDASASLASQVTQAASDEPATRVYTAFCQESNGHGTVWISPVEVDAQSDRDSELQDAATQARYACAHDWDRYLNEDDDSPLDISGIVCMGLAEGNVTIAMWDDSHLE
ncbi:hypothetical protein [Halomonas sp. PA16-9]|jgi:hypothetical protein|uniref:hypothetical protein n=1 Tax=Halomonas sp. PA16-9 TaxID=2576841 RepID=UPI0012DA44E6|nr:hypothetical protein FDY98_25055 [Halomonas sp. PA16-9]|tara:strand:- start:3796 stop:4275 length:480 start_codon:yes stop_codon:yes gene_type:complete